MTSAAPTPGRSATPLLPAAAVLALFAWQAWTHRLQIDDAFISYRYARHLADGLGLVWNAGERVEGYSNFLWVLILAAGLRAGLPAETFSIALEVVAALGVLWLSARLWRRVEGGGAWVVWLPLALAAHRSFGAWSTAGLGTQAFAFCVLAAIERFLSERERSTPRPAVSALWLVAACLVRPEGPLFAAVLGVFFLGDVVQRRRRFGALLCWGSAVAVPVALHFLWRFHYYGDWLPNTFHAKVSGAWWSQSAAYFGLFLEHYPLHWFLPLAGLALLRGPQRFASASIAVCASGYLLYLGYVGGDRFEFRQIVPVLPLIYFLLGQGCRRLSEFTPARAALRPALRVAGVGAALALLLLTLHGSLRKDDPRAWGRTGIASLTTVDQYARFRIEQGRRLHELAGEGRLPRDLPLCLRGAGALAYYTDWSVLDYHGLNDRAIARQRIRRRGMIAHEKQASIETMQQRGVVAFDVFNGLLFRETPRGLRALVDPVEHQILRMNAAEARRGSSARLELRCRKLGAGEYLVFATPNPQLEATALGHLEDCGLGIWGR